jgi:hypothetical protein
MLRKKFKSHGPAQAGVFRSIDDTHPSFAELTKHTIMRNELGRQG